MKNKYTGPEGGHRDERDVGGDVRQLPLYPAPALRPEQRPVHRHHEALRVYQRHLDVPSLFAAVGLVLVLGPGRETLPAVRRVSSS